MERKPDLVRCTSIVERIEPPLCSGSCLLADPDLATIVQNAFLHFDEQRYLLYGWVVMPNHWHVLVEPLASYSLSSILHSWKSFTANLINAAAGRTGPLYERESFDHLIRNPSDIDWYMRYCAMNPVFGGLCMSPEDFAFSHVGHPVQNRTLVNWTDPRKQPYVSIRERGELPHLEKNGGVYFITTRLWDAVER